MARAGNEKPTHVQYQPAGTGDDIEVLDFRALTERAYQNYQPAGTGDDIDNLTLTGYGAILDASQVSVETADSLNLNDDTPSITLSLSTDEDELELADESKLEFVVTADDGFDLSDSPEEPDTGGMRVFANDVLPIDDEFVINIDIFADDGFDFDDDPETPTVGPSADDGFDFDDDAFFALDVSSDDGLNLSDSQAINLEVVHDDGTEMSDEVQIRKSWNMNFSTSVEVVHRQDTMYTTESVVLNYDPAPINDFEHPDNPVTPTVVVNGDTVVSNPDTINPDAFNYVSLNESAIAPNCDLKELTLIHSLGGTGTFTVRTLSRFASKGSIIMLGGYRCLVTDIEEASGDQTGDEVITSGTIGDARIMNKELLLILDTPQLSGLGNLALNTPLQSAPSLQWTTCSEAAQAIANVAGIGLAWLATDAPLTELFLESGTKVEDALRALAQRVNAFLVYDGNTRWLIVDPIYGYGGWSGIPNCGLFGTKSFRVKEFLDVNNGFVSLPIKPVGTGSVTDVGNPLYATPPPIESIASFSNIINSGDAPTMVPLNGDYDQLYMQVLLPTTNGTVVSGQFVPGTQLPSGVVMVPNGTVNPKNWFLRNYTKFKDTKGKEYAVVDHNLFHPDLVDNQFSLNVGYTRRVQPLADAFAQQQQEATERQKLEDQYNQERIRYFNTRTATINFKFFGSLPLPGNLVTALSYKDKSISGIVTSVRLDKKEREMPEVTIEVQEFYKFNLLMPRSILDYYFATGTSP